MNKDEPLATLIAYADVNSWDQTCKFAEDHYPPIKEHLETWGPHCGASRAVYRGHLVRMLIDLVAD